jgi:hypothetical protein
VNVVILFKLSPKQISQVRTWPAATANPSPTLEEEQRELAAHICAQALDALYDHISDHLLDVYWPARIVHVDLLPSRSVHGPSVVYGATLQAPDFPNKVRETAQLSKQVREEMLEWEIPSSVWWPTPFAFFSAPDRGTILEARTRKAVERQPDAFVLVALTAQITYSRVPGTDESFARANVLSYYYDVYSGCLAIGYPFPTEILRLAVQTEDLDPTPLEHRQAIRLLEERKSLLSIGQDICVLPHDATWRSEDEAFRPGEKPYDGMVGGLLELINEMREHDQLELIPPLLPHLGFLVELGTPYPTKETVSTMLVYAENLFTFQLSEEALKVLRQAQTQLEQLHGSEELAELRATCRYLCGVVEWKLGHQEQAKVDLEQAMTALADPHKKAIPLLLEIRRLLDQLMSH